jgi:adenosine/AMP kinase
MVSKLVSRSLVVLSLFFSLFVSSLMAEGSVFKVFLCVKDLSSLGSSKEVCQFPLCVSKVGDCKSLSKDTEDTENKITIEDTWHGLGHCFFLLVEESDATINNTAGTIVGRVKLTYGFGGAGKWFKTGQTDVEKIAQQSGNVAGVELFSSSNFKQAWNKFGDITEALDGEQILGYNLFNHNCCTAAFNAVEKVFASHMDVVNRTVNFLWNVNLGIGIKFKPSMKVIFSSSSSLTTTVIAGVAAGAGVAGAAAVGVADADVADAAVADDTPKVTMKAGEKAAVADDNCTAKDDDL